MKLIVGLGNPGPKYETTRHNIGFLAIDYLAEEWKAQGPDESEDAEIFKTTIAGEKVLLVKPQTFMNDSGKTVGPLSKFFKCSPEDIIVIHDDVDLKPMAIRIKTGGGTGGHNGLKSIDAHVGAGSTSYHRIRLGVGKPAMFNSPMDTADYVLQRFRNEELDALPELFKKTQGAVELLIQGKAAQAMNLFNADKKLEEEGK